MKRYVITGLAAGLLLAVVLFFAVPRYLQFLADKSAETAQAREFVDRQAVAQGRLQTIVAAAETYKNAHGAYPPELSDMVKDQLIEAGFDVYYERTSAGFSAYDLGYCADQTARVYSCK